MALYFLPLVLYMPLGRWNIRRYVIAGKQEVVQLLLRRMVEEVITKIFRTAENMGKDIDQFYFIVDLQGFNNRQHICLACMLVYTSFAQSLHLGGAHFTRNVTALNSK